MLTVIGTIGSLVVVFVLIVLAVLVIAVVAMLALAALAGSLADWRALWRRLTRRGARLPLKLSAPEAPARLRAELSGGTPLVSRRFRLAAVARSGERRPGVRRPGRRARLRGRSGLTSH
ncbi:hypothetical protein ACFFV7_01690 [Nonomuraea spiralis]|uniref:Uncharacterized protein n=1 Tax=Nonomuraea spiralis TaxID=46182 RepID=A0ABV5I5S8_9ACTN|nr:hypothetical protein [Nonomuraea spiralis]GGS64369.1 hypothetical protein GCM10010176_003390 [Nonomuraea spiralis]